MQIRLLFFIPLLLALASSQVITQQITSPYDHYVGKTDNWIDYDQNGIGVYVDVNFESLSLRKTPQVFTFLTCKSWCWQTAGATSIYQLDNKHFRVYIRRTETNYFLNAAFALQHEWVLNFRIISME